MKDPRIIDNGCHYFGYALMAYVSITIILSSRSG